jgi:hypothetical protein
MEQSERAIFSCSSVSRLLPPYFLKVLSAHSKLKVCFFVFRVHWAVLRMNDGEPYPTLALPVHPTEHSCSLNLLQILPITSFISFFSSSISFSHINSSLLVLLYTYLKNIYSRIELSFSLTPMIHICITWSPN